MIRVIYHHGYGPDEEFDLKDIRVCYSFGGQQYLKFTDTNDNTYDVTFCEYFVNGDPHLIIAGCAENF